MKRIFTILIVALLLSTTSSVSFADRRPHHEGNRKEWNKGHDKKRPSHNKRPGNSAPRPGFGQRPVKSHTPPPPPRVDHHKRLPSMVRYATRGCNDVNVWQVSNDTYVVKYRNGNRFYTRYLYPFSGQYGPVNTISVNWSPGNAWSFIPPIQLNINL